MEEIKQRILIKENELYFSTCHYIWNQFYRRIVKCVIAVTGTGKCIWFGDFISAVMYKNYKVRAGRNGVGIFNGDYATVFY